MEKITILDLQGNPSEAELAGEVGDMGITRLPGSDWRITHLPTTFALPYQFRTSDEALEVLQELCEFVHWGRLAEQIADAEPGEEPPILERIREVCRPRAAATWESGTSQDSRARVLSERLIAEKT